MSTLDSHQNDGSCDQVPWGPTRHDAAISKRKTRLAEQALSKGSQRVRREKDPVRPLEVSLAAVERHLAEGVGWADPEPRCATCKDTGWQELPAGNVWRRCWRGCDIPRKATESMGEVYRGPESFT